MDSQKYPLGVQQFRALSGSREEDNRKTRKAEGNALGMGSQNGAIRGYRAQIAFGKERKCSLASARSNLTIHARAYAFWR